MAVNATAIWRVRPSGSNTNGGGYDPGIASPGTDYSQQNAAQVTFNGTTITASNGAAGATITLAGYTVATTDVANAVCITGGTNFTTGFYFITSVNTGSNTWTLDRNCTTGAGAAMTGKMGGGFADPQVLLTGSLVTGGGTGPVIAGNTVYVLGSGIPNPASYTFDYTTASFGSSFPAGNSTAGNILIANDPNTPNYGSGGMPVWKQTALTFLGLTQWMFDGIWFVFTATGGFHQGCSGGGMRNCVADLNGFDTSFSSGAISFLYNFEVFSSQAKRTTNSSVALQIGADFGGEVLFCNIHDNIGPACNMNRVGTIKSSIIAKNGGDGITITGGGSTFNGEVSDCTIDGNTGHGITTNQANIAGARIFNNIISNHNQASKFGINCSSGTTVANDKIKSFIDYNIFYNNTTDLQNLSYGANDSHGGANPYTAQSTEDYSLSGTGYYNLGTPKVVFLQNKSGQTTTVRSYNTPGAVKPNAASTGGTTIVVNKTENNFIGFEDAS